MATFLTIVEVFLSKNVNPFSGCVLVSHIAKHFVKKNIKGILSAF